VNRADELAEYFAAHARRVHASLRRETKEERLLRAINGLMDEHARRDEHGDT